MSAETTASSAPGIVILGTPRSGTTLLRRILDAHSRIACPPETYVLSACARFLHEERFALGLRIGVLSGLSYAGLSDDLVLERLRQLAFGLLKEHANKQDKPRWAEKTAFDAFHIDAICRIFGGHVRFICLQRHGLDVVCSLEELVQKTGGYVQELHDYVQRYPEPLVAFAHAWVDTATKIAQLAAEDPMALDIRYEALVTDPEQVVRQVLEFVGEPWEDGLVERALTTAGRVGFGDWKTYGHDAVSHSSVDRWRRLPRPSVGRLAAICNPTLEQLGYDPVPGAGTEIDAQAARQRYAMGLLVNRMKKNKG